MQPCTQWRSPSRNTVLKKKPLLRIPRNRWGPEWVLNIIFFSGWLDVFSQPRAARRRGFQLAPNFCDIGLPTIGRNPFRTTWKPWFNPLLVGIGRGIESFRWVSWVVRNGFRDRPRCVFRSLRFDQLSCFMRASCANVWAENKSGTPHTIIGWA